MWVFGVDNWDGENIAVFRSHDLEHWEQHRALKSARMGAVQHLGLQGG